jgi:hypothetical protein
VVKHRAAEGYILFIFCRGTNFAPTFFPCLRPCFLFIFRGPCPLFRFGFFLLTAPILIPTPCLLYTIIFCTMGVNSVSRDNTEEGRYLLVVGGGSPCIAHPLFRFGFFLLAAHVLSIIRFRAVRDGLVFWGSWRTRGVRYTYLWLGGASSPLPASCPSSTTALWG